MKSNITEKALESAIEKSLTGTCLEEVKDIGGLDNVTEKEDMYHSGKNYVLGRPNDFNAQYALDETRFWHFLDITQSEELEKLQRHSDWKRKIVERYDRMIKKYGILHLLKKGFLVDDAHFILFYQLPIKSSSRKIKDNFKGNEFSEIR